MPTPSPPPTGGTRFDGSAGQRLQAALEMASQAPIEVVVGSALDTLEPVLEGLPAGDPAVVMNSFTLNQFTRRSETTSPR